MKGLNGFLQNFVKSCLYAVPLLLLIFYKQSLFPFLTFKVFGFYILIDLIVIAWAILLSLKGEFYPRLTPITKALLLFLVVASVSGLLGANPLRSFWSTADRAIGLIGLWHFFVYYLAITVFIAKEKLRSYFIYIFWVAVAVALSAVIQGIAPSFFYLDSGTRPGGTLGNPAYLAGFLLSYLFLGYYLIRNSIGWKRITYMIGMFIVAYSFLMANTRGAMLGLIIALALIFAASFFTKVASGSSLRKKISIAFAGILLFTGIIYTTRDSVVWRNIPGVNRLVQFSLNDSSITNRLSSWGVALKGFSEYPIFGIGPENFRIISDKYYNPILLRAGFSETFFDKPHNMLLETLATTGVIGFIAYLWLLYAAYRRAHKISSNTEVGILAVAALSAYIIQNLFLFDTFGTYLTFFIGLAALSILSPEVDFISKEKSQKPPRANLY